MLNRRVKYFLLCAVLFLSFPSLAFAEAVQGRVAGTTSSAVDMTVYDNQGRPYPNALHLKVDNLTRTRGVSSTRSLRRGDPIYVVVSQGASGGWHADSITKLQETGAVQSTKSSPSPSLAGALGNPVVRNGLMGAATGAIASSASGGKAGKGALIGAGVGILGGLLMGGGNQQQQTQQQDASVESQDYNRY